MEPQIQAAIALSVIIPVVVTVLSVVYIWLHNRRRQSKSPLDEEVIQSFQVNSVHKFVPSDDIGARASPPPFSPDDIARGVHDSNLGTRSSIGATWAPIYSKHLRLEHAENRLPDYSDKEVAPDSTLPEVISGPIFHERSYPGAPRTISPASSRSASSPSSISRQLSFEEALHSEKSEKRKERLTADEIIGIDRTFWLQDLPAYQPGRPPVLHVATANLGRPAEFVSPWDVEFKPNPIIFSHLNAPVTMPDPVTPVSAISANSPTSPIGPPEQEGPFEMDAVESEYTPWLHPPRTMIHGVPHRWEQTLGSNRMFFEAEHDLFPSRKRRSDSELSAPCESLQRKRNGARLERSGSNHRDSNKDSFADLTLDSPISSTSSPSSASSQNSKASSSRRRSQRRVSRRRSGRPAHVRSTHSDKCTSSSNTPIESPFATQRTDSDTYDEMQWQPTNGKNPQRDPTVWSVVDISFANLLAAQHEQQVKFFEKFFNMPLSPVSPVTSRGTFSFDGGSSPTSSSMRSFDSFLTPTTPQSSVDGSMFFAIHPGQSETSIARSVSSATTVSIDNLKFPCSECDSKFRTPGERKNHFNRKHNLRYICELCGAAFGLRKDLQRHESTVHKDLFPAETRLFCTNPGCATPLKEFNRKDNFNRHVVRCRQAVETRGTAQ